MKLINVYTPEYVDIWLRLYPDGDDLEPDELDVDDELGDLPGWFGEARNETGIDGLLDADTVWHEAIVDGHALRERYTRWALLNGIAPYQPFLLRVHETECSTTPSSPNGPAETDCWNATELRCVQPWPAWKVLRKWTWWQAARLVAARELELHRAKLQARAERAVGGFHVRHQVFGREYDRLQLTLVWQGDGPHQHVSLASGHSDRNDDGEAWASLIASTVKLRHLSLTVAQIRALPTRSWG